MMHHFSHICIVTLVAKQYSLTHWWQICMLLVSRQNAWSEWSLLWKELHARCIWN